MTIRSRYRRRWGSKGFTLAELLVAVAILAVIMLLVTQMIGDTSKLWKTTSSRIDAFQQARLGFQLMTSQLSQATTNTHWDYFNSAGQTQAIWTAAGNTTPFVPAAYGRQSELHFYSGSIPVNTPLGSGTAGGFPFTHGVFFQYPGGFSNTMVAGVLVNAPLKSLLNGSGYFVEFSPDVGTGSNGFAAGATYFVNGPPTSVLTTYVPKYRFRLVQFLQPAEGLNVYNYSLYPYNPFSNPINWFQNNINQNNASVGHQAYVRIVANNIIGLIIWPKKINTYNDIDPNYVATTANPVDKALAPTYAYDSRGGVLSGSSPPSSGSSIYEWNPGVNAQPLQFNQMPPILRVAMIAIDEPTAQILQGTSTSEPSKITTAFSGLFANAVTGTGAASVDQMDPDLITLQNRLSALTPRVNFQVFTTTIAIRSAKFANP